MPTEALELALTMTLRTSSITLHVLAGVLIIGTAISEIWLSLDGAGQWLFGIYGAAAAIALLGILAFYLAFVAEQTPPPPKPLKPKKAKRGRRKADEEAADETEASPEDASEAASETEAPSEDDGKPAEVTADTEEADEPESSVEDEPTTNGSTSNGLRNRRRRRLRGRVAVED